MHERYTKPEIARAWSDQHKLELWQGVELAAIQAKERLGKFPAGTLARIREALEANPIDIAWWKARDIEIHHDLQAFLDERLRFIPLDLQRYWHEGMTSFDTEEAAFARMILDSLAVVRDRATKLRKAVADLARRYRYTPCLGETHGQWADLTTFGAICLSWLADLKYDADTNLANCAGGVFYSKLSGAIGKYGDTDPAVEKTTLEILGFTPYFGATQITPREVYTPTAAALTQIVQTLQKIALSIRLGARSESRIVQEPFKKKQKGSSAMPHKKNPITLEQIEGMSRMALGYLTMIYQNIPTWRERAIEQSCVERVAWPDLFHVTVHSLEALTRVLAGLQVYPDRMLEHIVASRGCFAASKAKELLKELAAEAGITEPTETFYRIIQLAAFNVFSPDDIASRLRQTPPADFGEADADYSKFKHSPPFKPMSLQDVIPLGMLKPTDMLDIEANVVDEWNKMLRAIFSDHGRLNRWNAIFVPSYHLANQDVLYREILGE